MRKSPKFLGLILLTVSLVGSVMSSNVVRAQSTDVLVLASCETGAKIDGTTAEQTKKRIEAAGYRQVKDLNKGCDNVWHGTAVDKDGNPGNVLVTPQGQVLPEGN
jgi:hypothetical protein